MRETITTLLPFRPRVACRMGIMLRPLRRLNEGTAEVAADHTIARVHDEDTREALLSLASEIRSRDAAIALRLDAVSREIIAHVATCTEERRADEQWRASAARILDEMKDTVRDHCDKDDGVQTRIFEAISRQGRDLADKIGAQSKDLGDKITNQKDSSQRWMVGILGSVAGASCLALLGMIVHLIEKSS